ncbi:MAG: chromate transporter [Treponemataceae bacterium]
MKDLWSLFIVFFKIGSLTFGGGYAMIPFLECEVSKKRNWVTKEELLDYYAIAQSTPGMIAVNVATFLGYKKKKILGSCVATLGIVLPSLIIISIIASSIQNFTQTIVIQKALKGINVAVAVLLTQSAIKFTQASVKNFFTLAILLVSFCAIVIFNVPTVILIFSSALMGIFAQYYKIASQKDK